MFVLSILWGCAPFTSELDLSETERDALAQQVCVEAEARDGGSCEHTFGGVYADGACSAGFQCCDGAWGSRGVCGECLCVEPTGEVGCAPAPPAGESCGHTYGGLYADGACSAGYQCCDGSWATREACGECACVEPSGQQGCGSSGLPSECFDPFVHEVTAIPQDMRDAMWGVTWEPGCPVHLDDLRLITAAHWDFDGNPATGEIIVRSSAVDTVVHALQTAWETRFPIERMRPVVHYGGNDDASMAVNNTSAFNCRRVTGGSSWSQHSYGDAIDINPLNNPYVSGSLVLPPAGSSYLDRNPADPGVLVGSSPVTEAFLERGWGWGGYWSSKKDYQHFSRNGR